MTFSSPLLLVLFSLFLLLPMVLCYGQAAVHTDTYSSIIVHETDCWKHAMLEVLMRTNNDNNNNNKNTSSSSMHMDSSSFSSDVLLLLLVRAWASVREISWKQSNGETPQQLLLLPNSQIVIVSTKSSTQEGFGRILLCN